MVIDYILDRKDGYEYDVKEFYDACMAYEEFDIARALDGGTEKDVKKALCDYVIYNDYPKSICKYINSENWLDDDFYESKKSVRKSLKKYLVKGLDVDFVVDHLLSLEDPNNFDLINELDDLWKVYKKSWNKFNKSLSDFWKVMKNIEKLDSFDKTCKEIIDAWYDDIEKIFYSDDNLENLKLNYGFEGNDLF